VRLGCRPWEGLTFEKPSFSGRGVSLVRVGGILTAGGGFVCRGRGNGNAGMVWCGRSWDTVPGGLGGRRGRKLVMTVLGYMLLWTDCGTLDLQPLV